LNSEEKTCISEMQFFSRKGTRNNIQEIWNFIQHG